jgi:hypothetical protein
MALHPSIFFEGPKPWMPLDPVPETLSLNLERVP